LTTAVAPRPSSIPIVTIVNPDPIGLGLAQSLARPGGNVTGLTDMDFGIYGKRIEILKQSVPNLERAGVLNSRGKPLTGVTHNGRIMSKRTPARSASSSNSPKPRG
jgi:ABC-type uncharacterized transport system substrate-binding protein